MSDAQALLKLVAQSQWANARWVEVVYAQPAQDARPRELLAHILLSERVWFERIVGQQVISTTFAVLSKGELIRGFAENGATYRLLIGSRLPDVVHFRRGTGEEYHATVADIIYHLGAA